MIDRGLMIRRFAVASARRCPLCEGDRGISIWRESGFSYLRCVRCQFVFSDISNETYEEVRHNVWDDDDEGEEALAFYGDARKRVHARFLDAHMPPAGGRLLDVGCGLGFFLSRAAERGWDTWGCDTSATWARSANRRLRGQRVIHGTIDTPELQAERFDLVTAWDVVEHIYDSVPFLAGLARMVKPGGSVFLRTPNFSYVYPIYSARRGILHHKSAQLGPTNHVTYFTRATMGSALSRAGLEAVSWRVFPPPQVSVSENPSRRFGREDSLTVLAKNLYARGAGGLARATGGHVVLGADLDVEAVPVQNCDTDAGPDGTGSARYEPGRDVPIDVKRELGSC